MPNNYVVVPKVHLKPGCIVPQIFILSMFNLVNYHCKNFSVSNTNVSLDVQLFKHFQASS